MVRFILVCAIVMFGMMTYSRPASALEGHEAALKDEGWKEDQEYVKQDQRNIEPSGVAASQRPEKEVKEVTSIPQSASKKATHTKGGGSGAKKTYHGKKKSHSGHRKH